MCLFIEDKTPYTATKDVVCYKIVKMIGRGGLEKIYQTPFTNTIIGCVEDLNDIEILAQGNKKIESYKKCGHEYTYITEGFIHTFVDEYITMKQLSLLREITARKNPMVWFVVYKCIIPKGTEYYEGTSDAGVLSYASDKIKFIKQVF